MAAPHPATPATSHLTHEQLLAALELRFDFQSARAVVGELLAVAGVAKAEHYDAAASAKLRAAAETSLTRANAVLAALGPAAPQSAAPAAKAAPLAVETAAAPAPEAAPPAEPSAAADAAPAGDAEADKADKKKKA